MTRPARLVMAGVLLLAFTMGAPAQLMVRSPAGSGLSSDTTPDQFTFTDQTDVATSTTITSAAITVASINSAAPITVSGGTYDINASGSFTSSPGTVSNSDTVRARHTSSASNSTATNTVVTIGGVSDTFTSTTVAGGGGAPDIVQHSFADDDSTTSLNIPFDTNVTAGSTLVAWVRMGTDGTQTVTHGGKTFTKLHEDGWLGWDCEVYALANANGGSSTVNVSTTAGADVIRVITAEFDGMPSALNLDDFASDTGSGTTANAGQVTVVEDGSLVLMGFCVDSDPEGYTAGPGMTLIPEPTSDKVAASWRTANAGNLTPTMGLDGGDWAALTVVLGP